MALMPCSECGKEISSLAAACPHCGAPVPKTQAPPTSTPLPPTPAMSKGNSGCLKMALVFAALIVGFFVVIFVIGGIEANNDPQTKLRWRDKNAIDLCWESYERKSLEPGTKRFVAMTCEKMESDFKAKYGRDP